MSPRRERGRRRTRSAWEPTLPAGPSLGVRGFPFPGAGWSGSVLETKRDWRKSLPWSWSTPAHTPPLRLVTHRAMGSLQPLPPPPPGQGRAAGALSDSVVSSLSLSLGDFRSAAAPAGWQPVLTDRRQTDGQTGDKARPLPWESQGENSDSDIGRVHVHACAGTRVCLGTQRGVYGRTHTYGFV